MKKSILAALVLAAAIQSCKDKDKKENNPAPSLSTRQQALIGKEWKLKSIEIGDDDITHYVPGCIRDNIIHKFTDASNGYMDEGLTKCEQGDSQRISLRWKLIGNETKIIIDQSNESDTFEIISVSQNELKYKVDEETITLKN